MWRSDEILRPRIVGDGVENCFRSIGRGNAGGDSRRRIDGYRKSGTEGSVFGNHH